MPIVSFVTDESPSIRPPQPGGAPSGGGSIRGLAVRASVWTTVSFFYGEGTRLASNVVIAYLFAREDNIGALGLSDDELKSYYETAGEATVTGITYDEGNAHAI